MKRKNAGRLKTRQLGNRLRFHVYAEDGFEGAYADETAARHHAREGSRDRNLDYRVIAAGRDGLTGGGSGRLVAEYRRGIEVLSPRYFPWD